MVISQLDVDVDGVSQLRASKAIFTEGCWAYGGRSNLSLRCFIFIFWLADQGPREGACWWIRENQYETIYWGTDWELISATADGILQIKLVPGGRQCW